MTVVAYSSPFVSAEWIAAHGLQPWRLMPSSSNAAGAGLREGVCPFAQAVIEEVGRDHERIRALILTSTCDQMRRIGELLPPRPGTDVMLMNVPATWSTRAVGEMCRQEMARLGRLLERLGGIAPSNRRLSETMIAYERARKTLLASQGRLRARRFVELLFRLCQSGPQEVEGFPAIVEAAVREDAKVISPGSIPVAIVGGPLAAGDLELLDLIEHHGGRVVLNAGESGERCLPGPFDARQLEADPQAALTSAYFGAIPDIFRRPNSGLYSYLQAKLDASGARGIIVMQQVWCDLWHAEVASLRQRFALPMLDLDISCPQGASASRANRVQSFLEILR